MLNFRLRVFYSVATFSSFTRAAEEMFITQPAVTKNIKELESELGIRLFNRIANKITLTEAGRLLLHYTEHVLTLDKKFMFDLGVLKQKFAGDLKLGASTTIGQYVLPAILAQFKREQPDIELSLLNDNTQRIETALIDKLLDLGIVEGNSKNNQLKYIPFLKDEIVAVAHSSQSLFEKDEITLDELKSIPLVLREIGSGSLEVITDKLKQKDIKLKDLNVVMHLGSTESIKTFLANSNSIGLISINAVSKEIANGEFKIIDIANFEMERNFYFIHLHGVPSGFTEMFIQYALSYYNRK
ncbi:DNA-binding transcriptional LysR family regulator [Dysgonomonas alginatilytica]|uniref:DNA-binding transcriptional LysR family regulator n=1 Tax=Dysgonomonas alginatilytica TaxID=1605892 RepID=A0A2V3PRJ1_9BACT|nr:LysR substrate-binding domain-containing protein [Dysgonomonas alginatilytica]PXV67386.1 DNA-binding transcriptional LysR family regulator [Dysgonomonas alginatilytica]